MIEHHLKRQVVSYKYALKGLKYAFLSQPNFWVHSFWSILAIVSGFYFKVSQTEWLVLVLTMTLVWVVEMVNTALEMVTDALKVHKKTEKDDFYIMAGKDVAAGAVLFSAIASIIVGLIIFGPKFLGMF